jgi:hypothetical protein
MSSRHLASIDEGERGRAVRRLKAAVAERGHARDVRESARDAQDDIEASASLRAANDQVEARERWLEAVEDHDY